MRFTLDAADVEMLVVASGHVTGDLPPTDIGGQTRKNLGAT
jgi:hypothetical protein